jgi:hypothetical protein
VGGPQLRPTDPFSLGQGQAIYVAAKLVRDTKLRTGIIFTVAGSVGMIGGGVLLGVGGYLAANPGKDLYAQGAVYSTIAGALFAAGGLTALIIGIYLTANGTSAVELLGAKPASAGLRWTPAGPVLHF